MRSRWRLIEASIATAVLLAVPHTLFAQSVPPTAPGTAAGAHPQSPIHDFRKLQPKEAAPSTQQTKQVDDEVKELLRQSDQLDKQFEGGGKSPAPQ
jgi:hypothetical protein